MIKYLLDTNILLRIADTSSPQHHLVINAIMVKLVSIEPIKKRPPLFGIDKDIISISDDFDEPLEDFKEYE